MHNPESRHRTVHLKTVKMAHSVTHISSQWKKTTSRRSLPTQPSPSTASSVHSDARPVQKHFTSPTPPSILRAHTQSTSTSCQLNLQVLPRSELASAPLPALHRLPGITPHAPETVSLIIKSKLNPEPTCSNMR